MDSKEIRKLIENNSNYWEKRALENKLNIIENEEDYVKRLKAIYDAANRQIDEKFAALYTKYAKENKLTLDEAYQVLSRKTELEYKNDLHDYISKANEDAIKWRAYLLEQSRMHSHTVLDQLRTSYRNVVYNIDMETTGGKFLEKIYANANYYAQYTEIEDQDLFSRVDEGKIKALLQEDWSGGGNFSESVWKDKEKLVNALDDIVIKGLATGESYDKMADALSKRMETSFNNARRLIMTESARMDNEGLLQRYKDTGVKQLIFVATLDSRTSEICRAMDGAIIDIEDAQIGLNVPPLHPYCRSVISPYYEELEKPKERMYRDKDSGKSTKGKYQTYKDYLEKHIGDKEAANALASTKNDIKTLTKVSNYIDDVSAMVLSNGLINIQSDVSLINKNAESYTDFIERHSNEIESVEKLEEDVKKDLDKLLDDGEMATRTSMESLEKILEDGRIKSQFETGKSATYINGEIRKEVEKELYGYDLDMDDSLRPIYGYLTNTKDGFEFSSRNGAMMYGNVTIVLKKKDLIKRTTFTVGDSLDGTRWDFKVPNLYENPTISSMAANRSLTDNYGKFTGKLGKTLNEVTENVAYIELQYHGGVNVSNIEKVYIHTYIDTWRGKQKLNIDTKQLSKLEKLLDKAGIDYEVIK